MSLCKKNPLHFLCKKCSFVFPFVKMYIILPGVHDPGPVWDVRRGGGVWHDPLTRRTVVRIA